jgi:uncharacterized membrane protein
MKYLILVHVLSAIIGIGPTYFGHVLLRQNQSLEELRASLKIAGKLELFPKIGGSIALITGLILVFIGDYGTFAQLWIISSLVAYVLIQVVVIGVIMPRQKKLSAWVLDITNRNKPTFPEEQRTQFIQISKLYYVPSALGVILFIMMILRPA